MLICFTYLIITYVGIVVTLTYNIYLSCVTRNDRNEYADISHEDVINVV